MSTVATTETMTSFTTVATANFAGQTFTIEGKKFVNRKPNGFRGGFNEELACSHRDCSVCPTCEATYANIVESYGQHYWVRDYAEWCEYVKEIAAICVEYA